MSTVLILDCYLDDFGCPPAFRPPDAWPHHWVRAAHVALDEIPERAQDYGAIVISGSAASVLENRDWSVRIEALIADAHQYKVPLFGVCYGHQLIAKTLFDATVRAARHEVGWYDVELNAAGTQHLPGDLPTRFACFLSHYDEVRDVQHPNMQVLAASEACAVQAFRVLDAPILAVQFHAEFSQTEALELFDIRVGKTPGVVADPASMRERALDTLGLWKRLYVGFLESAVPRPVR